MITLKQLIPALITLGVDVSKINEAIDLLNDVLSSLDDVEVKGRQNVDTLLGCMMAIDAIIGNKMGGDENG